MARRPNADAMLGQLPVAHAGIFLILMFASMQVIGSIGAAVQIGVAGLLLLYIAAYQPRNFIGILKFWPLLLLPLMAVFSALWSEAPGISVRYGAQLLITGIIGILLARATSPRGYVAMLYAACSLVCILSILSGRTGPAQEGEVLVGLTGSKNEMAYAAQLLITSAFCVLIDRGQPAGLRLSTLFFIPTAGYIVLKGQAAGAMLTTVGALGVLFSLFLLHRFKLRGRLVILAALLIMIVPVYASRDLITQQAEIFMQDVLKKDSTLTGRTWLWERADELIREKPVIGHGYRAILLGDTIEGQGISRWSGLADRRAFHFHSTYRDIAVDLGLLGAGVFALTMLLALIGLVRTVIMHPTPAYSFFLAMFLVVLAKSPAELVIGQFIISASLPFTLWTWAFAKPNENEQWQGRAYHLDGAPLYTKRERRTVYEPVRVARPVRQTR